MYTTIKIRRALRAAFFTLVLSFAPAVYADVTLVTYDFDDANGEFENQAEILNANLAASAWSDLQGSLTSFTGDPGRALAARTFQTGNTLSLLIDIAPGSVVNLSAYAFDHLASSSGPSDWSLSINDALVSSGTTSTSFITQSATLDEISITDQIRIALSGSGASSNSGTYRIDNFVLNGTVSAVPIAPGFVLMFSALSLLPWRKRH